LKEGKRISNIEQGISNFEGNTHSFASIGRITRRFQRVSPSLPNPQVRIETYQAHGLPAVGRFLFSNDLASSSSWGMIVSAGFPRSELGRLMSQARLARIVARPVRAVSGQRNASHGPCTLDVADGRGQSAVDVWLLLLPAGAAVVRPALLPQWQWNGMLRDGAR
jgi:hypothetical protein